MSLAAADFAANAILALPQFVSHRLGLPGASFANFSRCK
jgi:hypothetical protein